MGLLEALIVIVLLVVSVNVGRLVWEQGRKPKPVNDSYFLHLQLNPSARPQYGDILFNFTKSQAAIVWTTNNDPNLGVVVLGRVPPAEWKIDDDVRVIGRSSDEAQRSLTPQPASKEQSVG